jgi:hypothetical protein
VLDGRVGGDHRGSPRYSSRGNLEITYVKVKLLLEWEELALLAQSSGDEQQEKCDADMQDTDELHTGIDLDNHKQLVSEGSRKLPNK